MWRPIFALIERELKRMLRQRGRLLSAMVRPLIWLLVIGTGFQSLAAGTGGGEYKVFLIPGLLCMVLLFGAMLASLSLVYDKESGVMRMLIIAPFPRYWIILARTTSAAIVAMVQALMLLLVLALLGYRVAPDSLGLFALALVIPALVCASLGMLIAVFSKTLENFAVIMNFVIFPMFFVSGALYPLKLLPPVLKTLALINPFSYGVDLMKHALATGGSYAPDFTVAQDLAVMGAFVLAAMSVATLRFSQSVWLEKLARVLSNPRRG
ncbi:MAG: ABC transporter permease [Gammaproteobacteria bacterium]